METHELSFAAQIRTLANELRQNVRSDYYLDVLGQYTYEERFQRMASWDAAHPLDEFIPAAILEIERVAALIKTIKVS